MSKDLRKKKVKCQKCKGTKFIVCPICHGTGSTFNYSGYRICFCCESKLVIPCPNCNDAKNEVSE